MSAAEKYKAEELPLVSIAMCTYNGEKYLAEQINSLLAQTYAHIEVVVVDDASTDTTRQILEEYSLKDKRLRYFVNEQNIGFNRNFEKAISLCSGNFIAVSDQDDIWEAGKTGQMMKEWPAGSFFVYSLSGSFTGNDFAARKAAPNVVYTGISDVHMLVFNSPVHGHACMFRKELVPLCTPFPEDIFYDWWMSMHAAATGVIGCIPQTLTWHRQHESNSSRFLTSIKDEEERNEQLRKQCAFFIETFCSRDLLQEREKDSLMLYASLLKEMNGKKFSWKMFRYVIRNRKLVFHYKKPKPFIFFSYLKHAYRMAYRGLL